jgi:hypothetical protein
LAVGWNLVSLPIAPALPTVAAVFGDPDDASAQPQSVLTFDRGTGGLLPALSIQALQGYWVHAAVAGRLVITGVALSEPAITLAAGWNLVGVPEEKTELPGTDRGVGPWLEYNPALAAFQPARELRPGQAYWVCSPAPMTLAVGSGQ